jgi:hypothetical protein
VISFVIRLLAGSYVTIMNARPLRSRRRGDAAHEGPEAVSLDMYPFF